jgi:hypothetical protein
MLPLDRREDAFASPFAEESIPAKGTQPMSALDGAVPAFFAPLRDFSRATDLGPMALFVLFLLCNYGETFPTRGRRPSRTARPMLRRTVPRLPSAPVHPIILMGTR